MIKIQSQGDKIAVETPYNKDFIEKARLLNGKWDSDQKHWTFPAARETNVRQLCREIYGTDGEDPPGLTVRVTIHQDFWRYPTSELTLFGRQLLKRWGRDDRVVLGEGVAVTEGEFTVSGGSSKYPDVFGSNQKFPLVLEVENVPPAALEIAKEEFGSEIATFEILGNEEEVVSPLAKYTDDEILAEARRRGLLNGERNAQTD